MELLSFGILWRTYAHIAISVKYAPFIPLVYLGDRMSCTRSRMEYHLNMVGAELLNRAYKDDYSDTDLTAVLLPGCMRALPKDKCEAEKLNKGLKCIGCVPTCKVNKLRLMGLDNDFEVFVIPHASDLSLWSLKEGEPRCGVVASACVTTLVEGDLELKRYGVPAQCVLLDYSGCKKHWHPEGKATSLNHCDMERVLVK